MIYWGSAVGGLLADVCQIAQLTIVSGFEPADLLEVLLAAAGSGLESYVRQAPLKLPADYRPAFREAGFADWFIRSRKTTGLD